MIINNKHVIAGETTLTAALDVALNAAMDVNSADDFECEVTPSTSKSATQNVNKRKRAAPRKKADAVQRKKPYKPRAKRGKCSDKLKLILDAYMQHKCSYIM
jgi:hypothetical protein